MTIFNDAKYRKREIKKIRPTEAVVPSAVKMAFRIRYCLKDLRCGASDFAGGECELFVEVTLVNNIINRNAILFPTPLSYPTIPDSTSLLLFSHKNRHQES